MLGSTSSSGQVGRQPPVKSSSMERSSSSNPTAVCSTNTASSSWHTSWTVVVKAALCSLSLHNAVLLKKQTSRCSNCSAVRVQVLFRHFVNPGTAGWVP